MHRPLRTEETKRMTDLVQARNTNALENRRKQLEKIEEENAWLCKRVDFNFCLLFLLLIVKRIKHVEPSYKATDFDLEAKKMEEYLRNCSGQSINTSYKHNTSTTSTISTKPRRLPPIRSTEQFIAERELEEGSKVSEDSEYYDDFD